ncbi:unnamed protein product [Knipowitschia caucasica]
MKGQSV